MYNIIKDKIKIDVNASVQVESMGTAIEVYLVLANFERGRLVNMGSLYEDMGTEGIV